MPGAITYRNMDATHSHVEPAVPGPDDIAIVGFSFKLPQGVDDDAGFWDMLQNRRNMKTGWPESRINIDSFLNNKHHKFQGREAHFIKDDATVFDAPFFSVTAKEAASMDPMQRWTLEASYHAFENAGIPAESLRGSRTAVFSASMEEDYTRMVSMDPDNAERTAVTGSTVASIIPNRVSWYFDMNGPSVHVNTACSSALAAFDLAYKTIQCGDASCALVTGCNLLLDPAIFQLLSDQNFLSPDGVCHSFDHRANGYARGEGIIAVVLKPVSDAVRDGDMIRAVIRGAGSNQDGQTPVMTQPNQKAQEYLINHVYKKARLPMDQTRYVEAHGTGTPTGDPVEMKAIGKAFREFRSAEEPLYVGAVKANIGHLEGASALAGIIKCILILEKGIIPPNPLFEKINPAIDVDFYRTVVPTQPINWPGVGLRRISVNSFGFGGSNTHVVLDDAYHYLQERGLIGNHCTAQVPGVALEDVAVHTNGHTNGYTNGTNGHTNGNVNGHSNGHTNGHTSSAGSNGTTPTNEVSNGSIAGLPKLLVWSAADEKAANRTIQGYDGFFKEEISGNLTKLDRLAFTLAVRRSQMLWRTFAVVMDGPAKKLSPAKPVRSSGQAGLAYVFTGQGAQYVDMGFDLIQYPVFTETLRQIDAIYTSLGCQWSIFDELRNGENINKPQYSQPLSTAVQLGLVELLKSFGVAPKAVVGHSSGEIAAAYAIGALSLQSACKASYYRGQLAGKLKDTNAASPGAMMSINLAEDQVDEYLKGIKEADFNGSICVACINSPFNCTLSGLETDIDVVKAQADKDGIFAQKLKTGVGYHSSSMLAIADEYRSLMGTLDRADEQDIKVTAKIPMISSVSGKVISQTVLATAQYWVDNMVSPVRFSDALQLLAQEVSPLTDLVEVGPHPALRRPVQDTISQAASRKEIRYTSTLHRSQPAVQAILDLAGQLFCLGHSISITAVNQQKVESPPPFLVDCPKYPFNHSQKYWAESRMCRDFRLRANVKGETLGVRSSDWNPLEPRWRRFLCLETDPWIGDHRISGTALFPGAGMLVMAIEAVQQMVPETRTVAGFLFKKAEFVSPILVKDTWDERTEVEMHLRPQKSRQSDKEDPTWFDATIYSYTDERWSECFRATIQIEYQSNADESEEKRLVEEGIRNRHQQATDSCVRPIDSVVLYRESYKQGLQFGDWFQVAQDVHYDGQANAVGRVDVSKTKYQTTSLVHPVVVDTAFMMLRVSAGQQPAANVPIRLEDAWFASSGWQHPKTDSIRWCATSTSALHGAQAAGYGEQGTLAALADDGTVLCSIRKAMTAAVSVTKDSEQKLLHNIEWKPQFSLLEPEQLSAICHADYSPKDETTIVGNQSNMCHVFDLVAARALKHMDRAKVPDNQRRHLEWLEYQVAKLTPEQRQEGETMTLEDVDVRLSQVEAVLPSWKLYTACARKLPELMAGDLDPLSIVYAGELANIFYADLFENICADSRLDTLLNLASHENPAMRVLEVGAGTGGMTGHVLKKLQERENRTGAPSFAEYSYTDISPMFFERASGRWPQLQGRMKFKTLDLDRDIKSQGFEPASYDLVIAASVLHATPYLEPNIRNVRKALKPGGRLILLEITNPEDTRTNFMAGLVPGFWVAREKWRPHSPAVSEEVWDKLLQANGFSGNDVIMRDYQSDECHITSIIISTALEEEKPTETSKPGQLVLITDGKPSDAQQQLANTVRNQIDPRGEWQVSICDFARDQLSKALANLSKEDVVVCLAEVNNRPLLANLSEEEYASLKYLIGQAPNLFWVTATSTDDVQYASYSVLQGFLRSIRAEQPDNHIVTLAIEGETDEKAASFIAKTFQTAFSSPSSPELEYVVRHGTIMTGRAIEDVTGNSSLRSLLSQQPKQMSWAESPALQLTTSAQNSLDALQFVEDAAYENKLAPHEVEIEATVWGVSERDVQTAVGRADNHRKLLGTDCAGVVTRVGLDSSFQPGDRVGMVALGCMRKFPRALETSVFKLPNNVPFDVAASVLVPGITAHRALVDIAHLEEGEKVLIHAGASSVGQLAIQIAKLKGADIFATTSSNEEKRFLVDTLSVNESHIFSSNNTSFAKAVMRLTEGRGVDVVLNSLSGSDELQASCECTARYGRLVEIGRANIEANAALPMAIFSRNITFSAVDPVDLTPKITARLLKETMQLLDQSKIQHPQPLRVFNVSEIKQAFKQLQNSGDSGRVVVSAKPDDVVPQLIQERRSWTFDENSSYLVAGGSGGLGRAIIRWMTDRGAKNLIVPSRSGASSKAAREVIDELTARGVNAIAPKCDVSSETSLASMLEECAKTMPPIKGCINAATVLQDAIFQQSMTYAQWDLTVRSKVQTSLNLHRLLPDNLDFFILLSSLAGINGQMASSNYAGGCSAQDALALFRAANGQKALSLNIGWMRNIGLIAETGQYQRQRQEANDMQQIDDTELLGFLTIACDPINPPGKSQVLIGARTPAHALAEEQTPPALLDRPLWSTFSFIVGSDAGAGDGSSKQLAPDQAAGTLFRQAKDADERTQVVLRALAVKLARAMSISPDDVESSKPLSSYGVDSLMAVELRNWIGREFSAPVPVFKIMGGTPITEIANVIVAKSSVGKNSK